MLILTLGAFSLIGCSEARSPVQPTSNRSPSTTFDRDRHDDDDRADIARARARLAPINGSGIKARLFFRDRGNVLKVRGEARGMDPAKVYVSLLYDPGSVPTGPNACLPTNNQLTFTQMVVGYWVPVGSSVRTLLAIKAGPSYASLNLIGTASVRWDTQPTQPLPSAPDPNRFQLQACGSVVAWDDD